MKIPVACYSETGNRAKIASAIWEGVSAKGHETDLMEVADGAFQGECAADTLNAYDLVFLGSACHDADLVRLVKQIMGATARLPCLQVGRPCHPRQLYA